MSADDGMGVDGTTTEGRGDRAVCSMTNDATSTGLLEATARAGITAAMALAHGTATAAGWYRDPATGAGVDRNFGEVIALIHSELSEALEAHRTGATDKHLPHHDAVTVELADCMIRIMDTAAALGLDLATAVVEKNRFNRTRADHSLAARRAPGGKRY